MSPIHGKVDLLMGKVVTSIGRITRRHNNLDSAVTDEKEYRHGYVPPQAALKDSNLVVSRLPNGNHAPAIDFDLPVFAIPSSTPGHTHVYIEHEMSWDDYAKLLRTLVEVGLVEPGYLEAALHHEETAVRLPGITKPTKHACPACGKKVLQVDEKNIGRPGIHWEYHYNVVTREHTSGYSGRVIRSEYNETCEMSGELVTLGLPTQSW